MIVDLDMKLTRNFSLGEAAKSSVADRLGIDNTPPAELVPAIEAIAEFVLQPARDHFRTPIVPSSWYRCQALDKAIRSVAAQARWTPKSQHIWGQAVDFEVPGVSNLDLASWLAANIDFDQLILEFHNPDIPTSGWCHVSYVGHGQNRREMLQFHPSTGWQSLSLAA